MTCKDCVHLPVCDSKFSSSNCGQFKNKANVLEIPDTVIIHTKDKWLVLNMESEDLGGAIKSIIDYCTKNARKE